MNHIHRSTHSVTPGASPSETSARRARKSSSGPTARFVLRALAGSLMIAFGTNVFALPIGGAVSAGSASIATKPKTPRV